MKISTRFVDDITILDIKGKITLGSGDIILRDRIQQLLTQKAKKIIINLVDVTYVDSSGIGELVSCHTSVTKAKGKLVLLNMTHKIKDLLQITQLIKVFDNYIDEEEAINSFK
jgi:anti-sigma B factor antagonist